MKVSELEINQEIEINGHKYKYQGVKKIRMTGIGTVQKIVFEANLGNGFDYKYFDLKVGNKDLKVHDDGKIELK